MSLPLASSFWMGNEQFIQQKEGHSVDKCIWEMLKLKKKHTQIYLVQASNYV